MSGKTGGNVCKGILMYISFCEFRGKEFFNSHA